jgi:hypothetical protein
MKTKTHTRTLTTTQELEAFRTWYRETGKNTYTTYSHALIAWARGNVADVPDMSAALRCQLGMF